MQGTANAIHVLTHPVRGSVSYTVYARSTADKQYDLRRTHDRSASTATPVLTFHAFPLSLPSTSLCLIRRNNDDTSLVGAILDAARMFDLSFGVVFHFLNPI